MLKVKALPHVACRGQQSQPVTLVTSGGGFAGGFADTACLKNVMSDRPVSMGSGPISKRLGTISMGFSTFRIGF